MGLESLAAGADVVHKDVKDVGMTSWQYGHDVEMQNRSYNYNRALNNQMAALAADARRNSYVDAVEGARRAGLHPSVTTGTGFGSVSTGGSVGAPSGGGYNSAPSGLGNLALEARKFDEAERNLMNSQAANLSAEAHKTNIEAQNLEDENEATQRVAALYFDNMLKSDTSSDEEKDLAAAMITTKMRSGAIKGYNNLMDSYPKYSAALRDKVRNDVESKVEFDKLMDKDYATVVSQLPKEQVNNIRETTKNLAGQTAVLELELERTKQDTALIKKQQEQVNEQIKYLKQLVKATHNKDFIDLWNSGQYLGSVMTYANSLLPSAVSAAGTVIGARTLLKGRSSNPAFQSGGLMDNEKGTYLRNLEQ